jgi:hypothetical protein
MRTLTFTLTLCLLPGLVSAGPTEDALAAVAAYDQCLARQATDARSEEIELADARATTLDACAAERDAIRKALPAAEADRVMVQVDGAVAVALAREIDAVTDSDKALTE